MSAEQTTENDEDSKRGELLEGVMGFYESFRFIECSAIDEHYIPIPRPVKKKRINRKQRERGFR